MGDEELRGAKRELREVGRSAASELVRVALSTFVEWVKTRPLKRLVQRRRAARKET